MTKEELALQKAAELQKEINLQYARYTETGAEEDFEALQRARKEMIRLMAAYREENTPDGKIPFGRFSIGCKAGRAFINSGKTPEEISRESGINLQHIKNLASGNKSVMTLTLRNFLNLTKAVGCRAADLIDDEVLEELGNKL